MNLKNIIRQSLILVFMLSFSALQSCAQPPETPITHAQNLVKQKQYLTAFEFLDSLDPANKNPDIFMAKSYIAINYHIATVMHQMFAFENLNKDQKIENERKQEGKFRMKEFPIQNIFDTLIQENPKRYDLYNKAVEFYYEILKTYPEGWVISKNDVNKKIEELAPVAIKNNVASAKTYYAMAYLYSQKEDYNQAMTYYAITLDKDPQFAAAYYNLALTQMYREEFLAALAAAQGAITYYTDSFSISESSRLAGYICEELSDDAQAYKYFREAWNLNPQSLDNIHALTDICVRLKKENYKKFTEIYLETEPENSDVYGGLIEIYAQYNKPDELSSFFESQFENYKNNVKASANLYYFTAGIVHNTDKQKAIKYLTESKKYFLKFLNSKDDIILIIDSKLDELKK